jgi:hypothetical protein
VALTPDASQVVGIGQSSGGFEAFHVASGLSVWTAAAANGVCIAVR